MSAPLTKYELTYLLIVIIDNMVTSILTCIQTFILGQEKTRGFFGEFVMQFI